MHVNSSLVGDIVLVEYAIVRPSLPLVGGHQTNAQCGSPQVYSLSFWDRAERWLVP